MELQTTNTRTIAGRTVEVTEDGFFVKPEQWTEEMAPVLAKEVGIDELTDRHWKVIHFIREGYEKDGKVPSLRAIKKSGGVPIQELYALFPEGPGKKSAYVAGLGKPEGCV